MRFVGVDLAWSENNPSGVAGLELRGDALHLLGAKTVMTDEDILSAVSEFVGERAGYVTVDAPLVVPNETGRRPAEEECGRIFAKYHAGAHPANRQRLSQWTGRVRGEDISSLLEDAGFEHDPHFSAGEQRRLFFEVYPHPSMVAIFGLDRIIPYKHKAKRSYEDVWEAFGEYQRHLRSLSDPALVLPEEIASRSVEGVRGKALKEYEDVLDAVFCAYIAAYAYRHADECAVLGSFEEGYILTPLPETDQQTLAAFTGSRRD